MAGIKRKAPTWSAKDIAKASAAAGQGTDDPNGKTPADLLDVGARAIYEFRAHPRKKPWESLDAEAKAPYLDKMRTLKSVLVEAGYKIGRN